MFKVKRFKLGSVSLVAGCLDDTAVDGGPSKRDRGKHGFTLQIVLSFEVTCSTRSRSQYSLESLVWSAIMEVLAV